jgi:NADH-quinone oxidoreductase subunit J
MNVVFYFSGAIAVIATALALSRPNAVHALLNLIVSLLAVAVVFFVLGARFVAALEVIVYAGAIMVVFVFVVMLLNLGEAAAAQEREWLRFGTWLGPALLAALLLAEVIYLFFAGASRTAGVEAVTPKQVGIALFGPYLLGVELASLLLLAGLVGAHHLGRRIHHLGQTGGKA